MSYVGKSQPMERFLSDAASFGLNADDLTTTQALETEDSQMNKFQRLAAMASGVMVSTSVWLTPAPAHAQVFTNSWHDYSECSDRFLHSDFGKALFAFAWPTATYHRIYCARSTTRGQYTLYTWVVQGKGIWGESLWTEVGIVMNTRGQVIKAQFGAHNNPMWPPGTAGKLTAAALQELFN